MLSIRYRLHRMLFLAAVVPIATLAAAHEAEGQGLTFTASPSARWIQWDDDLGFDDSRLLGGAVGLGFGRYVGLEAFHHEDDDVALFSGDASPFSADVAVSGARVTLALGTGRLVPVVGGGASVLRLRPDGVEATKKLSFDYGVGFRAVLAERIQGEVTVEQSQYRLDPGGLVDPDLAETGPTRRNLMLRAGLGIQLGRRSFDRASALDDSFAQRYQAPFTGFALAIEPLVGRLDFDSATGLAKQDMVGIRAGVDFGSFFGLRAFHWWGTESDFRTTNGMRALGGEAQFNLSGGPGLTPYLAGGAARLTWSDRGNGVQPPPSDQTAAVIGGGVDFNFGPRVRLTVAARDYILAGSDLAASPDLGAVADPDELIHNWQFSGGLKLVLGGGGGLRSGDPEDLQPIEVDATEPLADTIPVPATEVAPAPEVVDSVSPAAATPTTTTAPEPTAARIDSSRVIVLPVPEVGELYVRFGEAAPARGLTRLLDAPLPDSSVAPAAIDADRLRAIIREELGSLQPDSTEAAPPAEDPRVQALEAKIDSLARLVRELAEVRRTPEPAPVTEAVTPAYQEPMAPAYQEPAAPSDGDAAARIDRSPRETRLFSGFTTSGGTQVLLGAATDLGPLSNRWSSLHLIPSFTFGSGEGRPSYLAQLALEFRSREVEISGVAVEPMLSLGAGLFRAGDFEAVVPAFAGATLDFNGEEPHVLDGLFLGVQGVDFLNGGRFLIGLRSGN